MMLMLLALELALVGLSWQQQDPVAGFCRRWGHQTAVVDTKLWIDGGQLNWNPPTSNISNTWLLYNDLTTSPSPAGMPQLVATNYKNATVPDVTGGVLWEDAVNKRLYLYGGEYLNTDGITPTAVNLWSFDALYNFWGSYGAPAVSAQISGVAYAGSVAVSALGFGFAFGGWMSNLTVPGWTGDKVASSGLIKYDMGANTWTNFSGPDTTPRAEGVMLYIPASDNGLLIYFGGITAPYYNSTMVASDMSEIYVYDITSGHWYTQTATGQVPPNRRRFCAGAAWAADQSSYNIYIYGGLGFGANATGFDDVWILSLPSFTWTPWYIGTTPGSYHNSLSCNVVNNAQMLIIGGTFPASNQCDSALSWGTHNLDLTGAKWQLYRPNLTTYSVPTDIISIVGGSAGGGATATAPAAGFQSTDLSVYFTQKANVASRTPTRAVSTSTSTNTSTSTPSSGLSSGAIAGIAVGCVAVLLLALLCGFCILRRRRRSLAQQQQHQQQPPSSGLGYAPNYAFVPQGGSPHSPYTPGGPSPYHNHPQLPVQQQYYETEAAVPVELAGNNYHMDPTKNYPAYAGSPDHSPQAGHMSPAHSYFGRTESNTNPNPASAPTSATSPTPTYTSVGRTGRKPVELQNTTYYSP